MDSALLKYSIRFTLLCTLFVSKVVFAQSSNITGLVQLQGNAAQSAHVSLLPMNKSTQTNHKGEFHFKKIPYGTYQLTIEYLGAVKYSQELVLNQETQHFDIQLVEDTSNIAVVDVVGTNNKNLGTGNLKAVDGFGIYEGRKSEVVNMKEISANTSTNNSRQIFARVTGLNIWESDGAGLQMGVGGRGLSPNRTSNFNTRQNGYDISADALGYPESYYTPPTEALRRIEIVRGASSLQYGTQFGGMLNFEMNKGPKDKKIEVVSRQTAGSWSYLGSFNSVGGTVAKNKLNYYAFYQRKQGLGWRPNSKFESNTAFVSLSYKFNPRWSVNFDYTFMNYLAQQPGGLTDANFYKDPSQSVRARNYFKVNWNLMALTFEYRINENTKLNIRNFGLLASRQSLGILDRINVADLGGPRDLISGDFKNIGNETRLIHHYKLGKTEETVLVGFRLYKGNTRNQQGMGSSGSDADFNYVNPGNLEGSDYTFPNYNAAVFLENIFFLSPKISVTPGLRYEYIKTSAQGYYRQTLKDGAGNVIVDQKIEDSQTNVRSFLIGGLGLSYKMTDHIEWYSNFSQNYRAINFSDLKVNNPSLKVDPNMKDEKGYTFDLGVRGSVNKLLRYELTGFYIKYNGRIGVQQMPGVAPTFQDYRYRTNIADARNVGVEAYAELDIWKFLKRSVVEKSFSVYGNFAYVNAVYQDSENNLIDGNTVEQAPAIIFRMGANLTVKNFRLGYQYSYTSDQYSDATNAEKSATAVIGIIPAYYVMDLSAAYTWKALTLEASVNNLLDARYFTRRADSYPGPGIIPSDARGYYVTLQIKI